MTETVLPTAAATTCRPVKNAGSSDRPDARTTTAVAAATTSGLAVSKAIVRPALTMTVQSMHLVMKHERRHVIKGVLKDVLKHEASLAVRGTATTQTPEIVTMIAAPGAADAVAGVAVAAAVADATMTADRSARAIPVRYDRWEMASGATAAPGATATFAVMIIAMQSGHGPPQRASVRRSLVTAAAKPLNRVLMAISRPPQKVRQAKTAVSRSALTEIRRGVRGGVGVDAAVAEAVAEQPEKPVKAAVTPPTDRLVTTVMPPPVWPAATAKTNHCPPPTACGRRHERVISPSRKRRGASVPASRVKGARARAAKAEAGVAAAAARVAPEAKAVQAVKAAPEVRAVRGAKPGPPGGPGNRARAGSEVVAASDEVRMTHGRPRFPGGDATTLRRLPDVMTKTTKASISSASKTRWARTAAVVRGLPRTTKS